MRQSFHKRVLYAFCALTLLPLTLLAVFSSQSLQTVEKLLRTSAIEALDEQAAKMLELRAIMVADEVRTFLRGIENDLAALVQLEPTAENYLWFSRNHRRSIWIRTGTNAAPEEARPVVPLYSEVAFIAADGREKLRVVDERLSQELRDVSAPKNTTYLTETYFSTARDLPPGRVHVTHLTGWHVSKEEQLQGAATPAEAIEGKKYEGVIRFARPVHNAAGQLEGVVVLSLDHRHLMEFTQHITPTDENYIVFPSYQSGNYAFMFDKEGWIITHPKLWDIRGLDRNGHIVPPYTENSPPELVAKGIIPFNLKEAGFIHPNYPVAHQAVMGGRSGVVDVTNVGGSQKIMAFAPIFYDAGPYAETGVFGGITIGAEVSQFHKDAEAAANRINRMFTGFIVGSWVLIGLTALLVVFAAYRLSQSITGPLSKLISGTREMARGNLTARVDIRNPTEVADLAAAFNAMARQLHERRDRLLRTLADLRRSRQEMQRERDFKQTIVENVEVGILTLDDQWRVTSLNGPAKQILKLDQPQLDLPVKVLLAGWREFWEVLEQGLAKGRWSEYVTVERNGQTLTFRLTLYPISSKRATGRILTIEDLTERVNFRQQLARIERLASLGRLSAGIAHEVRNPLTGISLLLDELHDRMLEQPGDRNLIQRALHEIERLETLVNELLNFASSPETRLDQGDVAELLRDTLFLVKKQFQRNEVRLEEDLPAALLHPRLDADKLKQAFLNLFTNALDAMPQGGVLRVSASSDADGITVVIADSGEGIDPERVPLIFEPFFTTKGEGTGLGLSITHAIISNHGGRIEVDSQRGQGTLFRIDLPFSGRI